jgi:Holliday junction resolvase-like predicted endonuclease
MTDGDKAEPNSPYTEWIFALGNAVEQILVEQWKQMGIWVANNVKFYDKERNISGEVDVILRNPETGGLVVAEVKSLYGYHAVRDVVKGTRKIVPRPKTSQLLQAVIYADYFKDTVECVKMVYYARDSAARREYDITLVQSGETGRHHPCIDGQVDDRFTLEDIYDRYEELREHLENGVLPPRDYEKEFSPEKIEQFRKLGDVSKTAYEEWKKGKSVPGDWQCRYCNFSSICGSNDE